MPDTINDIEDHIQGKTEETLLFAEKICDEHRLISIQDYGKIYHYNGSGLYKYISDTHKKTGGLDNIILKSKGGRKFTVAKRNNIRANISAITYKELDLINPEKYINFTNGFLNIKTKEFINHSPDLYFINQVPYEHNAEAISTEWLEYLDSTLNKDLNKIKLLQEFCGYCFLKTCKYEKALFLSGGGGAGKSTFTETIIAVFGRENCSSTSLANLVDPVLRCSIRDKYVNFDSDLPEKVRDYEDIFKKISSGEAIKFNEKFLPAVDERVRCKMIFNVNNFPYIRDSTSAFYRRMILINFDKEFGDGADVNLKEKLITPENLSGTFNWCMEGLDRLLKNNKFSTNVAISKSIADLKRENNPVLQFIEDETEYKPKMCIPKKDVWEAYKKWSIDNGFKHFFSLRRFSKKFYEETRKFDVSEIQKPYDDRCKGWSGIDARNINETAKWAIEYDDVEWSN